MLLLSGLGADQRDQDHVGLGRLDTSDDLFELVGRAERDVFLGDDAAAVLGDVFPGVLVALARPDIVVADQID